MVVMTIVAATCLAVCYFLSFNCQLDDSGVHFPNRHVLFLLADDLGKTLTAAHTTTHGLKFFICTFDPATSRLVGPELWRGERDHAHHTRAGHAGHHTQQQLLLLDVHAVAERDPERPVRRAHGPAALCALQLESVRRGPAAQLQPDAAVL